MRLATTFALSFFPARGEFKSYTLSFFRNDLLAALAVALLTIPQSIAYSLLAGLPPTAGLLSAIFGTIFSAGFCSSPYLIVGPSTGVSILIQTSISDLIATYFEPITGVARDALVLHILNQMILIVGIIQIGAAFFNVSKLLQFVSRPVILGYFAGIVVATFVHQLYYFLGIPPLKGDNFVLSKAILLILQLTEIHWMTLLIGGTSLILLLLLKKKPKNWQWLPDSLFVLVIAVVMNMLLGVLFGDQKVETLSSFPLAIEPFIELTAPLIDFKLINKVIPAALAIAFLAILEVSSISRNFPGKNGKYPQGNQDAFGLGLGNTLLSCFVGAMPVSGSATRTSLNYNLHAHSRLAALFAGLLTLGIILFFLPLVQLIPLASLAALMLVAAPALINRKDLALVMRATREDRWVFLFTCGSCLIFNLDIAFFIGIALSIAIYLRRSSVPHLVEYAFNAKGRLTVISHKEDPHRKVRIIGIGGDLYFGSADVFQAALHSVAEDPNVQAIVLRLTNVHHMDASMCLAIEKLRAMLASQNRYLVISGLTEEVWHVFHRTGLVKQIGLDNLYFTDESNPQFSTWKACLRAQELIHHIKLS
jgi:sulfate permease, SulP family